MPIAPDAPTGADFQRLRTARSRAHRELDLIEVARRSALQIAFRNEISTTLRSASPFLAAMLASEGLSLDEAALLLAPPVGWPLRPRLRNGTQSNYGKGQSALRHNVTSGTAKGECDASRFSGFVGHTIIRAEGGALRIDLVGHSLEATAQIGKLRFESRFGLLRIVLDGEISAVLAISSVGRLIEDVVDHHSLRGRGWRIVAVDDVRLPLVGQTLVVKTGALDYRPPWLRQHTADY